MLIRVSGYNNGVKEYLEEGNKAGRDYSREELDERVILSGDLDLTQRIYQSIEDEGQERYVTFTLSFAEDDIPRETLQAITEEFESFLMVAYRKEEYNFYAEAHLPRLKEIKNKATGEMEVRKPHIHVVIPRRNLLSDREMNPRGMYDSHVAYFEAFQEYINQKYQLTSPRDRIRIDPTDASSILSRYKGDDFRGKNRDFKEKLVSLIVERDVRTREQFHNLVAEFGETRVRNEGKENEYLAVKLPGDAKFTNLKDTIFHDSFIVHRELKKPPLERHVINERLRAWPERAKEIKYVSKATPSFRKLYNQASPAQRHDLLAQRESQFYLKHGEQYGLHTSERAGSHQRSPVEAGREGTSRSAAGLQDLSGRDVADHREGYGEGDRSLLLPRDAYVHLGQQEPGGDPGLRHAVRHGRAGGRTGGRGGSQRRSAPVPSRTEGTAPGRDRTPAGRGLTFPFPPPVSTGGPERDTSMLALQQRSAELSTGVGAGSTVTASSARRRPAGGRPSRPSRDRKNFEWKPGPGLALRFPSPPPYVNPLRSASIKALEQRASRLFGSAGVEAAPLPMAVRRAGGKRTWRAEGKAASTVAGYFLRRHEENQIGPAQRRALWRVDQQFHETRRALFADERFSRQEKQQLLAVLAFERMKARQRIEESTLAQPPEEDRSMGSKEIRALLSANDDAPENSISGGRSSAPARERMQRLMERMKQDVSTEKQRERARELSAADLYTKRARFSQNVHYLDKQSDKTLFVDTGKAITLRREAMSESAVKVALELAKERFGSTLTIKGSEEFKRLVVETVAKNGLDVHFTDKGMNQLLSERRAEIEAEREGATITAADLDQPEPVGPEQTSASAEAEVDDPSVIKGVLLDHGDAPYKHDPKQNMSYYVRLMTAAGEKMYWGVGLKDAMEAQDFRLGQAIRLKDMGTVPVLVRTRDERTGLELEREVQRRGWAAEPVARSAPEVAAEAGQVEREPGQVVTPEAAHAVDAGEGSAILAREARWERNSGLSMAEVGTAPAMLGMRAEEHAVQVLFGEDGSEAGRERVASLMEHEAYRATFQQVVRDRTERLNPVLREELLVSPGYALARSLIEQAEQRYGAVPDAVQEAQKAQLEDQERQRQETDWIDVDAAIAAIEAQDRAFEAQMASEAPSPTPVTRDEERQSALTPKERAAEQQASPEVLPDLQAKHDKNIARRANEREFKQWSKEQLAADPERFEQLSSKEKRAEFREWKAGETERDQDPSASAPAEVEVLEIEETGPEPD